MADDSAPKYETDEKILRYMKRHNMTEEEFYSQDIEKILSILGIDMHQLADLERSERTRHLCDR